ncbi:MAG: tetratricopeptide repeat protein [Anaerolineae bacterium]|nr:tetratricopeptide repeat protein [Anaerolineae bacterium]
MPKLSIRLLGPFSVVGDKGDITQFETDTARALLAYLALHVGTHFRRDTLATLFWPDHSTAAALHALRQTLSRLRRAIGDKKAEPPFLQITRQSIALNPQCDIWVDVDAFKALVAATNTHPHRRLGACRFCLEQLRLAADLYRGELLAGFTLSSMAFEEWLLMQRESLHCQAMQIFYNLADSYLDREDYALVQQFARRQLEFEPWREGAYRQLMLALALSGQRSAALAQYGACCAQLERELGIDPTRETQDYYSLILNEELVPLFQKKHNLPVQLTSFVGRQEELQQISEKLNHLTCRLLTLAGPGGIGKTRLALQAAYEERCVFHDGVIFVPLSTVNTEDALAFALVQALGLEVQEKDNLWLRIGDYLRKREVLLVLDNFEQLVSMAERITTLLHIAPDIRVLVTSRICLNVPGEWVMYIAGLGYPADGERAGLTDFPAVNLFVESAQRISPGFSLSSQTLPPVVRITQLVEGMPLAIELASGWLQVFSCSEIADQIGTNIDLLEAVQRRGTERHSSLRFVFDTSWGLLSSVEKDAVCRLAVFPDSFDKAAAQEITGITPRILLGLLNKSFLRQSTASSDSGTMRYEMHDLLRRCAQEKLAQVPDVRSQVSDSHAVYYLSLLAEAEDALKGAAQREALNWIALEIANIRTAWHWTIEQGETELLAGGIDSLFMFYDKRSAFQEGSQVFHRLVEVLSSSGPSVLLAKGLACKGWFDFQLGQCDHGETLLRKGLATLEDLKTLHHMPTASASAFVLGRLGQVTLQQGAYEQASQWTVKSLDVYREIGDIYGEALQLSILGAIGISRAQYAVARQRCQESLELARTVNLQRIQAHNLRQLGNIAYLTVNYSEAEDYYHQAIIGYRALGNRWGESASLSNLGSVAARKGDYVHAKDYFTQSLVLKEQMGDLRGQANGFNNLGVLDLERGNYEQALDHYGQALSIQKEIAARREQGKTLHNIAYVFLRVGCYTRSYKLLLEALSIRRVISDQRGECRTLGLLGLLLYYREEHQESYAYSQQALEIAREIKEYSIQAYALTNMGYALTACEKFNAAREVYEQALKLRREFNEPYLIMDILAGLLSLSLAEGSLSGAGVYLEEVLDYIAQNRTLEGAENPFNVYFSAFRVLQGLSDSRADEIIHLAYGLLQEHAANIKDPGLRDSFLNNVASNREITRAFHQIFGTTA